jgi:RND family efflux transporter MFP subunit
MSSPKPTLDDLRIERSPEPEPTSQLWPVAVGILVLALVMAGIWWLRRPAPVPVRTVVVREANSDSTERTVLNSSGYVTARRQATVSAKITAKVVEVLVEEGMKVQEGQVLARLDDTNIKTSLRLAEAQLVSATNALAETRVRLREAEQEMERVTGLVKNKIATPADYDHAEAAVLALKARLEQQKADVIVAEKQVASWEQQMDDTIIRAPFTGIVTSKNAQPGEMISPISAGGGFTRTGICTIVDMESLEIEIDVNESYINRVKAGQPVEASLDAYPEWKIPCKVIAIIPTADRQKSTVKVRVGFNRLDPRILPEMSIKVAFREAEAPGSVAEHTVVAPKMAVLQRDGREVVLVVKDGHAVRRPVKISKPLLDEVLISEGVVAGDRVIVDSPPGLTEGAAVTEKH